MPQHKRQGQRRTEPKAKIVLLGLTITMTKYLTVVDSLGLNYKHLGQIRTEPKAKEKILPGLTIT
jgi:hypothetical protein